MTKLFDQRRRQVVLTGAALAATSGMLPFTSFAASKDPVKVGVIISMSGQFASTGKQVAAAIELYQKQHGTTVAGREVQVIVRDDGGVAPDATRRIAQEMVTRDKVDVLAGFALTPLAYAAAPIATQSKTPMVVMAAATSAVVERSPFVVRTGFTLPQVTQPLSEWASQQGLKKAMTFVSDYGPGIDAEKVFVKNFVESGGEVLESIRAPLMNPDYSPFLKRVKDSKPEVLFVFVPSGEGAAFIKQFHERGLADDGIQLICTGDVLDDDLMGSIGEVALGVVSSHHYSAAHDSEKNKEYVKAFQELTGGSRPNFHSVGAYDGMHLIYQALEKTAGDSTGPTLLEAMKGLSWESVRGPISIDPETRDVVQNVYIRRGEKVGDQVWNVEFDQIDQVKDPGVE
ncbi:MAG TPA: ABC transporter substrate-binding protein [Paenalcaligenes hominis]|uniref:ABC transporter substrate-binding protein n=1 Tax=Paenalcaligenes hominis TaxID=643674 RepID=A0A9D2VG97_9BURK|nr:ABC transporter substrate-binding protein [Paenalcaligenes hominis]NJB65313.1 branched-chain amino acid transport system substrate-binding protein [Paenalcaligenes hominis]GGE72648.1 ABC transporter substrate-binding protein [Paenalcaligenes hominis]HJH23919.1 ABC transporter substrate-binding protein [Paenalcaligenes hominis]